MRDRTLVFTTCYNERENIGPLVDRIAAAVPDADILVVDDSSPDGTWTVLEEKRRQYPQLACVQRPRKLGIGSAHKYALFYAMREGYSTLVTMDADFSHSPEAIPDLLARHGPKTFVTGSRYCAGGTSDYRGYRNLVSRLGNFAARVALGVRLRELTTYFRVFDVASLRSLPLRKVAAQGYSYGVELIHYLKRGGVELREVPIHFVDRSRGASKIPRMQVLWSARDLAALFLKRVFGERDPASDRFVDDACAGCGDRALAMKHFGRVAHDAVGSAAAGAYRCTAVGRRQHPPVYVCLRCGLAQIPASAIPARLEELYESVVDARYLDNAAARRRTFRECFDAILPYLPHPPGTLLEVGAYCGFFLEEARRRGWQVDGVEPSRWAATYAREHSGVPVHQGFLADNRSKLREHYDVVVSWDVLEHLRDPVGFLHACAGMLRPGGVLCFSTLAVDTWFPRLMGTRWPWLMDMHICYFERPVIGDLLRRSGLELVHDAPYAHFARLGYALDGLAGTMPPPLSSGLRLLGRWLPAEALIRVSLGDIRLFVARKR